MKKSIQIVMAMVIAVLACSCTAVKQTAPVMAIGSNSITTNVKADLDYKNVQKIQGSAVNHRVLWIFNYTPNGNKRLSANNKYKGMNKTESVALYRAKNATDVDIVLEPEFETETHSYFFGIYKRTDVKAKGWGTNIKGFKEGEPAERNEQVSFSNSIF